MSRIREPAGAREIMVSIPPIVVADIGIPPVSGWFVPFIPPWPVATELAKVPAFKALDLHTLR